MKNGPSPAASAASTDQMARSSAFSQRMLEATAFTWWTPLHQRRSTEVTIDFRANLAELLALPVQLVDQPAFALADLARLRHAPTLITRKQRVTIVELGAPAVAVDAVHYLRDRKSVV